MRNTAYFCMSSVNQEESWLEKESSSVWLELNWTPMYRIFKYSYGKHSELFNDVSVKPTRVEIILGGVQISVLNYLYTKKIVLMKGIVWDCRTRAQNFNRNVRQIWRDKRRAGREIQMILFVLLIGILSCFCRWRRVGAVSRSGFLWPILQKYYFSDKRKMGYVRSIKNCTTS